MLDKMKFDLLLCIKNCQDHFVSKDIIYNSIKWNYSKMNDILDILIDEKLVHILNFNDKVLYSVSNLGDDFINIFLEQNCLSKSETSKSTKNHWFSSFHTLYLAPFIVGLILFILEKIWIILNN